MFRIEKQLGVYPTKVLIGFDVEWTKNYSIKNGNQPFCFSFVWMDLERSLRNLGDGMKFGVSACYAEERTEIPALIHEADRVLDRLLKQLKGVVVVGHQFSSDLGVLLRHPEAREAPRLKILREKWSGRRHPSLFASDSLRVFDTRYDLGNILSGKSRRLVDVCDELGLEVTQPEIKGSMTKMQATFYETKDRSILERLLVLNIRHSLSSAILYLFSLLGSPPYPRVNTNRILFRNLADNLDYLRAYAFSQLII